MPNKRLLQYFPMYSLAQELVWRIENSNGVEFLTDVQLRTIALACIEEEGRRDGHVDTPHEASIKRLTNHCAEG